MEGGRVDGEGLDGGLVVGWSDDLRALETGGLKLEEQSRISPKQDVSALWPRLTETPVRLEGSVGACQRLLGSLNPLRLAFATGKAARPQKRRAKRLRPIVPSSGRACCTDARGGPLSLR